MKEDFSLWDRDGVCAFYKSEEPLLPRRKKAQMCSEEPYDQVTLKSSLKYEVLWI